MQKMLAEFFSEEELRCKSGCGRAAMHAEFLDRLDRLRRRWGQPLILTSAYRCPEYNVVVSTSGKRGPHTTGRAVDVLIRGHDALKLLLLASELGFTGFGVQQKGDVRFLHLDDLGAGAGRPRPFLWSY